jgi:hypothetical protein
VQRVKFIEKAELKFGDKFDMSLIPDKFRVTDRISIVCPSHGKVDVLAYLFLERNELGCPECGKELAINRHTTRLADFIEKANVTHRKGTVGYCLLPSIVHVRRKYKFICRIHNTVFEQTGAHHLEGAGCPLCGKKKSAEGNYKGHEVIIELLSKHNNGRFEYVRIPDHVRVTDKIYIRCIKHNLLFWSTVNNHLRNKFGCPECKRDSQRVGKRKLIEEAESVHGLGVYDYSSLPENINVEDIAPIRCIAHDYVFYQRMINHVRLKQGCPRCAFLLSKWENDLFEYITKDLNIDAVQRYRGWTDDKRQEIDIFIPSLSTGIECNGTYWHSANKKDIAFHKRKQDLARSCGINLFYLWDDISLENNKIVLRNILSKSYTPLADKERSTGSLFWFDKDLCPNPPFGYTLQFESPPQNVFRRTPQGLISTYNSGFWVVS